MHILIWQPKQYIFFYKNTSYTSYALPRIQNLGLNNVQLHSIWSLSQENLIGLDHVLNVIYTEKLHNTKKY